MTIDPYELRQAIAFVEDELAQRWWRNDEGVDALHVLLAATRLMLCPDCRDDPGEMGCVRCSGTGLVVPLEADEPVRRRTMPDAPITLEADE